MSRAENLDFGVEEFYDDDDVEEFLDTDPAAVAAFAQEAISEEAELAQSQAQARGRRGGADDPYVADGERLQKVMARAGVASRRLCERFIEDGRVSVDGVVVTELGLRVDPKTQEIRVDGTRILTNPDTHTVMLNKPAGVVTTMDDPAGRPTVAELGQRFAQEQGWEGLRLVHVGRLDTETEGLLLLSNDGELAHRLMHPSYEIAKTYLAIVDGEMSRAVARQLMSGIDLEDGPIKADQVSVKEATAAGSIVEITLHSGRNRIVRRMLSAVGHPVRRLSRTRLGGLGVGTLKSGQMRELSGEEITSLQQEVGL